MQANSRSLNAVLTSAKRFIIPEFQRPYCWTKEQITQLWSDLDGAYKDYKEKGAPKEGEDYFLGPIVVANQKDIDGSVLANVVDGQQRLTTIHSLLWCFHNRLKGMESNSGAEKKVEIERLLTTPMGQTTLSVAGDDQANFQVIRQGIGSLDETRELGIAGQYLKDQVADFTDIDESIAFINYVLHQTTFILVETESYSAAWELFIGLNGKGKPLTPADLIKAYVCGTSEDCKAMAGIWNERVLPLENDATSAILDITRVGTGELGSDAKLFKLFERAWKTRKVTSLTLSDGAQAYNRSWKTPLEKVPDLTSTGNRFLRELQSLDRRDHTPVLLCLAMKYGYPAIFDDRFLEALESYQLSSGVRHR